MGDVPVAAVADETFEPLDDAEIEGFHFLATGADDVVMVVGAHVDLVETGAIAEMAAADEVEFFESGEAAVNGGEIAEAGFESAMNFLNAGRAFAGQKRLENRSAGARDPEGIGAKNLQSLFEPVFRFGVRMRMRRIDHGRSGNLNRRERSSNSNFTFAGGTILASLASSSVSGFLFSVRFRADSVVFCISDQIMQEDQFSEVVDLIRREDARYEKKAYFFVRRGLDFTINRAEEKNPDRETRHVRGPELLEGIRDYALDQFGPMALTLLRDWNIRSCRDFGEIVFQLVDYGVLGKTEDDSIEDFDDGFDFEEAFLGPFLPVADVSKKRKSSARARK